jgi:replicative DNA helicase
VENFKSDELFGMDKFNAGCAKAVVITEGELDAMSAYQMLGDKVPCVSMPSATPSQKLFEKCRDWLDSFEKIYVSFDSDMKAEPVAQKLANLFPNRVYAIPHDKYKDANEFLEAGAKESYRNAFQQARKYIPDNIFNTTEQFLSILHDDDDSSYTSTGIQSLDDVILGLMRGHFTVFQAPEGIGKQLPNSTLIPTLGGFRLLGDIEVGETLFGEDGVPTKVTAITETQHGVSCYNIVFSDGSQQIAGGPHRWGVYTTDNKYEVKTTEEMYSEGVLRGEGVAKFSVPICKPVQYEQKELPIDPYTLGMWLGDGHSASQSIFVGYDDADTFESLFEVERRSDEKTCINYWVKGLTFEDLRVAGLIDNKHIPVDYFHASVAQRLSLLQGMMDSDGSVTGVGCEYYSSNRILAEDFMELARSLGYKCRIREKEAKLYGKSCGLTYTVWFLAHGEFEVFKYPRKQSKVVYCKTFRATRKTIRHIEPVESVPSRCLTVDNDSHLFLCGEHYTVTHNTEFMRYLEYSMLTTTDDVKIAICHMEEVKKRSLLGLASYALKKNVTRKDLITNQTEVDQAIATISADERLYQFTLGVDEDPLEILERIRFLTEACGVHYIFFEPIQDLAYSRQGDESVEQFLSQLSTKLARLSAELNVGIVTIAHENDDGAIRDCRMIGKRASVVIKLERDKMAKDAESRNTTKLLVVKNRPTGSTGYAGQMFFDSETFTLSEKFM